MAKVFTTRRSAPVIRAAECSAINRVVSSQLPDKWWLTGPNYGLGTEHDSQADAKAAAHDGLIPANAGMRSNSES